MRTIRHHGCGGVLGYSLGLEIPKVRISALLENHKKGVALVCPQCHHYVPLRMLFGEALKNEGEEQRAA